MELRAGFKKTDVGVIPEDWDVKSISEIAEVDPDNLVSSTNPDYVLQYISLEDVDYGILRNITEIVFRNAPSRARRKVKKGDVLISTVRPNLKSHLLITQDVFDWICSTGFSVLRSKRETNSAFLYNHFFASIVNKQIENLITGSNYPAISSKEVRALQIPLPPTLAEQTAIANALSDADDLISSLEKLISKKRNIKQGTMQELLKPKEGWEVKKLGDFDFDISDGNYSSKYPSASEFKAMGIPFIRANNIKMMSIIDNDMRYISSELHKELAKGHLKKDDVLITTRGEIGQIAIVPDCFIGSNINAQIVRINTGNKIDKEYFAYFILKSETQETLLSFQTGSALKQLPVGKLKELQIIYPSPEEQIRIATLLSDMDAEINALESKLEKYKNVKLGMMQNLLTGKIRIYDNN